MLYNLQIAVVYRVTLEPHNEIVSVQYSETFINEEIEAWRVSLARAKTRVI